MRKNKEEIILNKRFERRIDNLCGRKGEKLEWE